MSIHVGRQTYGHLGSKVVVLSRQNCVVNIGSYCSVGPGVRFIIDGNHHVDTFSTFPFYPGSNWGKSDPVVGNDVWISADAVIYSGVTIGDGAVIAGQSVVTKSVPPYAVVAGNPARIVKYRFDEKTIQDFLRLKWWDLPHDVIMARLAPIQGDIPLIIQTLEDIRSSAK